jgi:outer membrane protein assembly factor BamB
MTMDLDRLLQGNRTEELLSQVVMWLGIVIAGICFCGLVAALARGKARSANSIAFVVLLLLGAGMGAFGSYFGHHRPDAPKPSGPKPSGMVFTPEPEQADAVNATELAALKGASFSLNVPARSSTASWNQWRGPERDGVVHQADLRADWDKRPPEVLWRRPIGRGFSSFALGDGLVYTMDAKDPNHEQVLCLDADTGKEKWSYVYPSPSSFGSFDGPRATPAIAQGRVFTFGARGMLLCLEAKPEGNKPKLLWQNDLVENLSARVPEWGIACSPLVEGNLVIVQPGSPGGSVVALDVQSGKIVWKALKDPSGYSSPVAATINGVRQVVCCTGGAACGLAAADGRQLWYYPWHTDYNGNIATPIVMGSYVFISSNYGHGCALLHITGKEDAMKAEPVYVRRNKLMRNHHSTCVLKDGYVYGFDSGPGVLRCVDLRKGEQTWEARDHFKGCPIIADDRLIILTEEGNLVLADASPKECKITATLLLLKTKSVPCWTLPALEAGKLFLRGEQEIICLDVKKG